MICGLVWYQQRSPQQYQAEALASLAQNGQPAVEIEKPAAVTVAENGEKAEGPAPEGTATEGETQAQGQTTEIQEEKPQADVRVQPQPQIIQIQPKKVKEMILCRKCFRDGNLPNILSHSDFEEVDVLTKFGTDVREVEAAAWTEEENQLLLELIQKHADEWEEIQKSFPERTKEEIILHYLELPLENVTSISLTEVFKEMDDEAEGGEKPIHRVSNPFSEFADPLLQHVRVLFMSKKH